MLTEGIASAGINPELEILPDGDGTVVQPEPTATSQDAPPATSSAVVPNAPKPDDAPTGDNGTTVPTEGTQQAPPADEPDLTNATPFTYQRADGTQATIDGTYRIPGEGLIVPEEQVSHIESLASRAESATRYEQQVRELEAQRSTFDRLTAWQVRDAQGNVQTLTGPDALEQRHLMLSRTLAAANAMGSIFDDPAKLAGLVEAQLGQDGQVYLVPNQVALDALKTSVKAAALEAELGARQTFQRSAAAPPPPEPTVESRAMPTVEQAIKSLGVTGLTDQDKQYLASHVPRFLRPATPDEQQKGLGKQVMDAAWTEFVKDRAAMRSEAAKAAQAAEQAGKFNAGMNQKKPQPATKPKPAMPAQPAPQEKVGKAAAWDSLLTNALAEMNQTQ